MPNPDLLKNLTDQIMQIEAIDAHEHLPSEEERLKLDVDAIYLFGHYCRGDLDAAGLGGADLEFVLTPGGDLEKRWEMFKPYYAAIRRGSYARAVQIVIEDLLEFEELTDETVGPISEALKERNKPGWYKTVLREKSRLLTSIQHIGTIEMDRELFTPVMFINEFITPGNKHGVRGLGHAVGVQIHRLEDLVEALRRSVEDWKSKGCCGLKVSEAYRRTLSFERVTRHEAETLFNRIFGHLGEGLSWAEAKPLQDYLMHEAIRIAIEADLTFVIHTGIQAGGHNIVENTKPTHLTNLFLTYPQCRFDIFHGGYPYVYEAAMQAKYFPNVFLDMAWMHIISPVGSRRALAEWLDLVPADKIIGFGGDYSIVEKVYGHQKMARENIAEVLAERVERGLETEESALELARMLLYDNPKRICRLEHV